MKSLRRIFSPILAILPYFGLISACGDLEVPASGPSKITTNQNDISKELTKLGRITVEHSSTLMYSGGTCGSRTN